MLGAPTVLDQEGMMIRLLYQLLGYNWDYRALRRGRYPQRVARRYLYRASGRAISRLFKP